MKRATPWTVEPDDDGIRPAGPSDACFYCSAKVGEIHHSDCVIRQRTVVLRFEFEYTVLIPEDWDQHMIEFHRNESSWCANNGLHEIEAAIQHRVRAAYGDHPEWAEGEDWTQWSPLDLLSWLDACGHVSYRYVREADEADEERDDVRAPTTTSRNAQ